MRLAVLLLSASTGVGYGLIGLEAASPLSILLVLWIVGMLLLAWRVPANVKTMAAAGLAFVCGFGIVWTLVLGNLLSQCKPPSCQTADYPWAHPGAGPGRV